MTDEQLPIHGRPNRWRRALGAIAVMVLLVAALAAGVLWHEPIRGLLRGHSHSKGDPHIHGLKQLWTCGMHPQVIREEPGLCPICQMKLEPLDVVKSGQSAMAGGTAVAGIRIDPVVVQNMGVRVAEVTRGPVEQEVRTVGYLDEAQPLVHDVSLRVSGWVEKLHADTEGAHLAKGDPLFDLYSPEIQVALEELVAARKAATAVAAAGTAGDDLSRKTAQALLDAARRKLVLWGLDEREVERLAALEQAPRTVTFTSPVTGHVTQKMVVRGSAVKAGDKALRIVDHSTLWLDSQVYAQDLPLIRLGEKIAAEVEGVPGKEFAGEVIFVHPHVDPATRTATVRMSVPNPDMALRPGMYATAHIQARIRDDAVLVPREAVIDTGARQVVFLVRGEGHFEPRDIRVGTAGADGTVEVLEGLSPGERVVTSGQFLLDAESRIREAVQKHLNQRLLAGAPATGPARATTEATAPMRSEASDELFEAYLKLQRALGGPQTAANALDVGPLMQAARKMAEGSTDPLQGAARKVADAAEALEGKPIDEQRKLFGALSDAMVALADLAPPTKAVAERLFVAYCPMAFNHKGGQWLQAYETIENPYYATEMKGCGEVKRKIEAIARPR